MQLNDELKKIINALKNKKTIAMLAPSFVIDFEYPKIILELRKIGFNKVVELTYAAKIISMEYHKLIKNNLNNDKQFICANCPSLVKYIEVKYPKHRDKLVNIVSPMVLMGRIVKKMYGKNYKNIFIGPCITKKTEAKESKSVDYVITFKELNEIIKYCKENKKLYNKSLDISKENISDFDKFYNDYTKIYPLAGGMATTMHTKNILTKNRIYVADGIDDIDKAIKKMENNINIKFLDMLFCNGGCIGGPGIISKESTEIKKYKIIKYREDSKKHKIGKKLGKFTYMKELKIER